MKTGTFTRRIDTTEAPEFIDITDWVSGCVRPARVSNGFVVVYSRHTTAAVKINENEPLRRRDMADFLEKLSPRHGTCQRNDFSIRTVNKVPYESPNGHAHCCQGLMLSSSETIPLSDSRMQFGKYQSIFFIELDHPRSREVMAQVVGE